MKTSEKLNYLLRLQAEYEKKGEKKYFIFQYLNGAGNELNAKFWSPHSSSRMAFELYSPLAWDDNVLDFEFEKQLPGLASGGMGPNIDVYIETKDEIIFVESKFTEKANLNYIKENEPSKSYLSPAYWSPQNYGKKTLKERFWKETYKGEYSDFEKAERFAEFCDEWKDTMKEKKWTKGTDWFEPKQETCHLSGILGFLFSNNTERRKLIKDKKIRLYNIYWDMGNETKSELEIEFVKRADAMVQEILNTANIGVNDFKMDAFTVQDLLKNPQKLSPHITKQLVSDKNEWKKFVDEVSRKKRGYKNDNQE
ncbi:MAG: hypothetical protein IJK39_05895 [Bacteroidales bacterium]|nr:hypothetical protein [Bacteroidales bacterium]